MLAPKSGEVFESKELCKTRLQAFVLAQGFTVVVGKSHEDRSTFHYIHHSADIRNDQGLEPRVVGDEEVWAIPSGVISPPRRTLMASTHNLLEFRDTLLAEERSRLEARILQSHEALLAEAQEAHGKANARGFMDSENSCHGTQGTGTTR